MYTRTPLRHLTLTLNLIIELPLSSMHASCMQQSRFLYIAAHSSWFQRLRITIPYLYFNYTTSPHFEDSESVYPSDHSSSSPLSFGNRPRSDPFDWVSLPSRLSYEVKPPILMTRYDSGPPRPSAYSSSLHTRINSRPERPQ